MNQSRLRNTKRSYNSSQGASLVEFAMVLPLLFTIIFGGIEVTRVLQSWQKMSNLAKESSNLAFRSCYLSTNIQDCLENAYSKIDQLKDQILPGSTIIISMYKYNNSSGRAEVLGNYPTTGSTTLGNTKYTPTLVKSQLSTVYTNKQKIVISEIYYRYPPISLIFNSMLNKVIYEESIY